MAISPTHAALFVDYENIYYYIKNRIPDKEDPTSIANATLRTLRQLLLDEHNKQCIVQHAYADFARIEEDALSSLYLIGVETHNVLGTDHKNAADMRLCIDALDTLYVRKEINTFVIVAGDRDYIPVVQHLRKHAKDVLVVCFKGSVSGDLLQVAEERNFVEADRLLPDGIALPEVPIERCPQPALPKREPKVLSSPPPITAKGSKTAFAKPRRLDRQAEIEAIRIMLEVFGDKPEIWLTPYLHRLRTEMPLLADYERKELISALSDKGAIAVEKRPGEPTPYSVIIVNWDHPDVREVNPGT